MEKPSPEAMPIVEAAEMALNSCAGNGMIRVSKFSTTATLAADPAICAWLVKNYV